VSPTAAAARTIASKTKVTRIVSTLNYYRTINIRRVVSKSAIWQIIMSIVILDAQAPLAVQEKSFHSQSRRGTIGGFRRLQPEANPSSPLIFSQGGSEGRQYSLDIQSSAEAIEAAEIL
jgi:hypothetical protein